jgi:hypothetical protein
MKHSIFFMFALFCLTVPLTGTPSDSIYVPGGSDRVAVRPELGTLIRFPHPVSTSSSMKHFTLEPVGTDFMTFEARVEHSAPAAESVTILFQNGETLDLRLFTAQEASPFHQFVKARDGKKLSPFSRYTEALVALRQGTPPSTFKEVPLPDDSRRLRLESSRVRLELVRQFADSTMTGLVLRVTNDTRHSITLSEADFSLGEPNRLRAGMLSAHSLEPCPLVGSKDACQATLTVVAEGQGFTPALIRVQQKENAAERGTP